MDKNKGSVKNALADSLRELMKKKLFEKITIKQICDDTGVIRATFYNYFEDKYDCLNWIIYRDIVENNTADFDDDPKKCAQKAIGMITENRDFYRTAWNVIGQNSFEEMLRSNLKLLMSEYFKRYRKPDFLSLYDNELLSSYYAECITFVVRMYVQNKNNGTTEYNSLRMLYDLAGNSIFDFSEGITKAQENRKNGV